VGVFNSKDIYCEMKQLIRHILREHTKEIGEIKKTTTPEFIEKAKTIHGDKYDYSKVKYKNSGEPVTIVCPIHGEFTKTPNKFISNVNPQGCPKCGRESAKEKLTSNKDSFVNKAIEKHGDKYGYKKVDYQGGGKKVVITCPIHGDFGQTPGNHLMGYGCPSCAKEKDLQNRKSKRESLTSTNTQKFIENAKEIHGDKYDYSKSVYKNNYTPIEIICSEHGKFFQTSTSHLRGSGCSKCGIESSAEKQRKSPEEFLKQIKIVHGDKYDFSKTQYKGASEKVIVTCPKHGDFKVTAHHLLDGAGCPKCARENTGKANSLTQDEFINKSNLVHDDKYDYSKVEYDGINNRVKIICPIHGEFLQTPHAHMSGSGCQKCGFESISKSNVSNTEDFIKSAKIVHGKKYNYSLVDYKNRNKYVDIVCPVHGTFKQRPGAHLSGQGCPICNESTGEKLIAAILEKQKIDFIKQYKFVDCTNKKEGRFCRKLPFDFYIPIKNVCVEYDGRQHFMAIDTFGGEEAFERQKIRDEIKNQYCKKNGIKLIRIPYTMKKEDIESYILKKLGIK
jgi:hypothetical protein